MSTEISTAIGVFFGLLIFIGTVLIEKWFRTREKRLRQFVKYAIPLQRQVCLTHDRLTFQRERKLVKGLNGEKSSVLRIDENDEYCLNQSSHFIDIQEKIPDDVFVDWCFHFGHSLSSTSYDIACFFAFVYLFQANNSISYIKKSKRACIEELIAKIQGLFDQDLAIWITIQTDVAQTMIQMDGSNNVSILSFSDFCAKAYYSSSLQKVFEFVIRLGDFGHRRQEISILFALYDLYFLLEQTLYRYYGKTIDKHSDTMKENQLMTESAGTVETISSERIDNIKTNTEKASDSKDTEREITQKKALELEQYLSTKYLKVLDTNGDCSLFEVDYQSDANALKKYVPPKYTKSSRFKTISDYKIPLCFIKSYLFPYQ